VEQRPFLTPDASPFRLAVERRSAALLVFLRGLPRPVPGLIVLALVAAGLVAPPVLGGIALLLVALVLAWVAYLSWPGVPPPARAIRLVVLALVIAYAFVRFLGS